MILRDGERYETERGTDGRTIHVFTRTLSDGSSYVVADHTLEALQPSWRDLYFQRAEKLIQGENDE